MIETLIEWLRASAQSTPLPLYVIVGGIVEEIVAPIPSPLVASLAGSIAAEQAIGIPAFLWICAIAAIAKTCAAWLFFVLAAKGEDFVIPRFGKFLGVTQEDLAGYSRHFRGGWRDDIILLLLRAIPVMPSTPISLACGLLKVPQRTFFIGTLGGFYIRTLTFMILGYTGVALMASLMSGLETAESVLNGVIAIGVAALLGWLYWRRLKKNPASWFGKASPPAPPAKP